MTIFVVAKTGRSIVLLERDRFQFVFARVQIADPKTCHSRRWYDQNPAWYAPDSDEGEKPSMGTRLRDNKSRFGRTVRAFRQTVDAPRWRAPQLKIHTLAVLSWTHDHNPARLQADQRLRSKPESRDSLFLSFGSAGTLETASRIWSLLLANRRYPYPGWIRPKLYSPRSFV